MSSAVRHSAQEPTEAQSTGLSVQSRSRNPISFTKGRMSKHKTHQFEMFMSKQSRKKAAEKEVGRLLGAYFDFHDLIEAYPEHPNFAVALVHLKTAMLWAKEGIGCVYEIGDEII